jgi:hypothetical protein
MDGEVQVVFKVLWKRLEKLIENLGRLVELYAKHLTLGQNMIKFGHNGF